MVNPLQTLSSKASGFNVSLGIPLTFGNKKNNIKKEIERSQNERMQNRTRCGQNQYHHGCGQYRTHSM